MLDDEPTGLAPTPLKALAAEDLEPFSIAALDARIAALEAEIVRARQAIAAKGATRSAADALFRKG
ncbi:MAG: hypothetical protein Tsb0016_06610 [Sphingomonadales bacterium]